jgi:hypothetical protein
MLGRGTWWLVALGWTVIVACSSSRASEEEESEAPPASTSTLSCTCKVAVNGVEKALTCGEETCLSGSTYRCVEGAGVQRGGACSAKTTKPTADPNSEGPAPSAPAPRGPGSAPTPTAGCTPPSCQTDADCKSVSASWQCFRLDVAGDKRGCFPSEITFGRTTGSPCLDTSRAMIETRCRDGAIGVCVPSTCTKSSEKPFSFQERNCF